MGCAIKRHVLRSMRLSLACEVTGALDELAAPERCRQRARSQGAGRLMGSGAPANVGATGSSVRASSHGCSCSHAHSSIPTSRRRPPLPRRTSSEPRRRSRSASPSARASWMRSPACHSTTNQSAQTTSVQAVADLAHNRNDSSIFGGSAGYRRPLSRGASGAKSGLGPHAFMRTTLRQLRGHLPLAREAPQSSRRPVGVVVRARRAMTVGERRRPPGPEMGMRTAAERKGGVAGWISLPPGMRCIRSKPCGSPLFSARCITREIRSLAHATRSPVGRDRLVLQRGDCSAVRSYRQSRRMYEAGGIY